MLEASTEQKLEKLQKELKENCITFKYKKKSTDPLNKLLAEGAELLKVRQKLIRTWTGQRRDGRRTHRRPSCGGW